MGDNRAVGPIESDDLEDANKKNDGVTSATASGDDFFDDDEEEEEFVDELKPGTQLFHGQFKIERFINSGGFGITYLARDSLDRPVVIKECFPGSFCRRSESIVRARSRAHQNEYKSIVRLFVQEAKSLSKLIHPNIVGVHQVFEDNDTAYMAIDFVDGRDLLAMIEDKDAKLTPDRITSYLVKLLAAVDFIHTSGVLHRDISPDNILVNQEDEPILIDFGAAREEASKTSRALSALRVVKDGYSPQEFYISGSLQSDSSDLYALAASFYHAITGFAPPNSQARLAALADDSAVDPYVPLAGQHEGYSEIFLEAIDVAMNVLPRDRIKSAKDWLAMIDPDGSMSSQINMIEGEASPAPKKAAAKEDAKVVPEKPAKKAKAEEAKAPAAAPADEGADADRKPEDAVAAVLKGQPEPSRKGKSDREISAAVIGAAGKGSASSSKSGNAGLMMTVGGAAIVAAVVGFVFLGGKGSEEVDNSSSGNTELAGAGNATDSSTDTTPAPVTLGETNSGSTESANAVSENGTNEDGSTVENTASTQEGSPDAGETGVEVAATENSSTTVETPEVEPTPVVTEVPATDDTNVEAPTEEVPSNTTPAIPEAPVELADIQLVATNWDAALPFTTEIVQTEAGAFPVISSFQADGVNEWVKEGVTIFAVNDEWVQSEDDIKTFLERTTNIDDEDMLAASVRIRTSEDGDFEHVDLALPASRVVELANGGVFRVSLEGGNWKTVVETVPTVSGNTLEVGDVLLGESSVGQSLRTALSLETLVSLMSRRDIPNAQFSVRRDGSRVDATMPLARK